MVAAFRGWNDGGQGATLGGGYLARQWGAEEFARIESENFYDFQAVRPHVSLEEGLTRKLEWPENTFLHAPIPGLDRDAVILLGVEPNLRWKTYSALVLELARQPFLERHVRAHGLEVVEVLRLDLGELLRAPLPREIAGSERRSLPPVVPAAKRGNHDGAPQVGP